MHERTHGSMHMPTPTPTRMHTHTHTNTHTHTHSKYTDTCTHTVLHQSLTTEPKLLTATVKSSLKTLLTQALQYLSLLFHSTYSHLALLQVHFLILEWGHVHDDALAMTAWAHSEQVHQVSHIKACDVGTQSCTRGTRLDTISYMIDFVRCFIVEGLL